MSEDCCCLVAQTKAFLLWSLKMFGRTCNQQPVFAHKLKMAFTTDEFFRLASFGRVKCHVLAQVVAAAQSVLGSTVVAGQPLMEAGLDSLGVLSDFYYNVLISFGTAQLHEHTAISV